MELKKINIKNYRSIENLSLDVNGHTDNTYTYSLIGVNEAGKSSILRAIGLQDDNFQVTTKDFKSKELPVVVEYVYELTRENSAFIESLLPGIPELQVDGWNEVVYQSSYDYSDPSVRNESMFAYSREDGTSVGITSKELPGDIHACVYWTAEEKYLISNPISLKSFASNPENISVPLRNCFLLAGIEDIKKCIDGIENDSTEREYLQDLLSKSVNEHIKTVWPNHPITITFHISDGFINFHVKDESALKAKVVSQRSDGFKQFVSFLLTISAENKNSELENTILLLDEPETHLHPQAQEYLLSELRKITKNSRKNIVIYATHSIFMIDKEEIDRNHKVAKLADTTKVEKFQEGASSYSSVIYEVFDIPSTDYHNQLFGLLHQKFIDEDPDDESRDSLKNFDKKIFQEKFKLKPQFRYKQIEKACALPTYIRNCIHHSENGNKYTQTELKESVELLRGYLKVV